MNIEKGNNYLPRMAVITAVKRECKDIYTFRLRFRDRKAKMEFMPGQFLQVMVLGVGEVPISVSSSPYENNFFKISVKRTGCVTEALFRLKKGDVVGVRGPYGNWYPMDSFKGKDIVIIAGGVGIAPLGAVVEYMINNREDYGKVWLLYGTHCPKTMIFKERMKRWRKNGIESVVTVSKTYGERWSGDVGHVEPLFEKYKVKANVAICCGPSNMLRDVYEEFRKAGIKDDKMYFSLERMMQCGVGKCGHCNIGSKYVCVDGPVFRKDELDELTEKIW